MSRIAGRFTRVEPRRRARQLVLGLLSDLPRKNCWTIAEWAGERTPDGMQHLLGRAKWDADRVRDDVCDYVVDHLHDDQAVLVVDETGDVKKGTDTACLIPCMLVQASATVNEQDPGPWTGLRGIPVQHAGQCRIEVEIGQHMRRDCHAANASSVNRIP